MGIRYLMKFIKDEGILEEFWLHKSELVIDGNNFTGRLYDESDKCQALFGGDYDVFARFVTGVFAGFKKCDVKCYVVFDGGHESADVQKRYDRLPKKLKRVTEMSLAQVNRREVGCKLLIDVVKQCLQDLDVWYFCCQYQADEHIMALARQLSCPVLSDDSDFFMSNLSVLPTSCLELQDSKSPNGLPAIHCKIYSAEMFLNHCDLHGKKDLLPIFATIQENDYNKDIDFQPFFQSIAKRIRKPIQRVTKTLDWLRDGVTNLDHARNTLLTYIDKKDKIIEIEGRFRIFFSNQQDSEAWRYLYTNSEMMEEIGEDWFKRGVLSKHISQAYVDVFKMATYFMTVQFEDFNQRDAFWPAMPILRFAYDLLTDYDGSSFKYYGREGNECRGFNICPKWSTIKPVFHQEKPFRHGFSEDLHKYLEHFLLQTTGLSVDSVQELPKRSRLFVLTLAWWSVNKDTLPMHAALALLLSHTLLTLNGHQNAALLRFYKFDTSSLTENNFKRSLVHSLAQFQCCLEHMNHLNSLCGKPLLPASFKELFNGTLTYNLIEKTTLNDIFIIIRETNIGDMFTVLRNTFFDILKCVSQNGQRFSKLIEKAHQAEEPTLFDAEPITNRICFTAREELRSPQAYCKTFTEGDSQQSTSHSESQYGHSRKRNLPYQYHSQAVRHKKTRSTQYFNINTSNRAADRHANPETRIYPTQSFKSSRGWRRPKRCQSNNKYK